MQVRCSRYVKLCVPLLLSLLASRASTDEWSLPERSETFSENRAYVLRVIPTFGSDEPYRRGTCRGILYAKKGEELTLRWERSLVNDKCPIGAFVSNSGKYVITVGEWEHFEKLPIVVYGVNGSLINVYGELRQIIDTYYFLAETPGSLGRKDPTFPKWMALAFSQFDVFRGKRRLLRDEIAQ